MVQDKTLEYDSGSSETAGRPDEDRRRIRILFLIVRFIGMTMLLGLMIPFQFAGFM